MKVKPCNPYTSARGTTTCINEPGAHKAYKVYFADILGRDDPRRYEWEHCPLSEDEFLETARTHAPEGVGFIVAFPHITKVFQFGPNPETNLYARAFDTATWEERPLDYAEGVEVGCAGELMIARDEFAFWLEASCVDEYLARTTDAGDASFTNHAKLREWCEA